MNGLPKEEKNSNIRELTCIGCPLGCTVRVEMAEEEVVSVTGYTCRRGKEYAVKEVTAPTRIVTSTVRLEGREHLVLPVKTERDIPKNKIMECVSALKNVAVRPPVHIGQVILENVAGTDVPVVATKNINE